MKRRPFVASLVATLAAALAEAQTASNVPAGGLLWIRGSASAQYIDALRSGLRALGWVDGKNIRIDDRFLVDSYEGLAAAATQLATAKVNVVLAFGTTAMLAAHKATTAIPIVLAAGTDPVKLGLAASLGRPGGSVTGLTSLPEDLAGKRLEMLKETVPAMRRFAVVLYPDNYSQIESLRNYEAVARVMNLELRPVGVRSVAEFETAMAGVAKLNVQAIAVVNSTLFSANHVRLVAAIAKLRLPAIYSGVDFAEAGGLMSFGIDLLDNFRLSAGYVDKILKGAKPGDLPIEQPTRLALVINSKTAKTLNLNLPKSILARVDRVID